MKPLFIGLALLFAGLSFGYIIGRQSIASETVAQQLPHHDGPETIDIATENSGPLEPVAPDLQRGRAQPKDASDAGLDRALLDLAARHGSASGEGFISGRIVDETGASIAGAMVVVTGPDWNLLQGPQVQDPTVVGRSYGARSRLNPETRLLAHSIIKSLTPAGTGETNAKGYFEIPELAEGRYRVEAYAEDFTFGRTNAATGESIKLVGRSVSTFDLNVLDSSGQPPPSATVMVLRENGNAQQFRWRPDASELRISSRRATLQAFVGDTVEVTRGEYRANARSKPQTIDKDIDGHGPYRFDLLDYPSVTVQVETAAQDGKPVELWCDLVRRDNRIQVKVKQDHSFTAFDVTAGLYTVEVGRGDGPAEAVREIRVEQGPLEVTLKLGPISPSRYLVARCIGSNGRPVQDVSHFGASMKVGPSSLGTSFVAKPRPNGEYWLSLERGIRRRGRISRHEIDSLTLVARSATQGEVTKVVDLSQGQVEFIFQSPCELAVQVEGALMPGLQASIETPKEGGDRWSRVGSSKDVPGDGSLVFQSLHPGPARVVLVQESSPSGMDLVALPIELRGGRNRVTIVAPETHDLVLHVPGRSDKQFRLLVEGEDKYEWRANGRPDSDERVVFPGLPAGTYRVECRGKFGPIFANYVVPCGEVVFEQMLLSGFEVTSVAKGSIAEEIGLRVGDVLVGAGQYRPSDEQFIVRFTSLVANPEGTNVRIRRGGAERDLTVRLATPPTRSFLGHGARFKALER